MKVRRISFRDFRNLQTGEIFPSETVNVIYGENAQGKTNLLEAVWLFTGERSFRGAKDASLVAKDRENAEISLEFTGEDRTQEAKIHILGGRRTCELNGVAKKSCSALMGAFCAVIFSPEHLSLIQDGPAARRRFMDAALCQYRPAYAGLLGEYHRALGQRNALLKDIPRHAELLGTLDIWDEKLAKLGEAVARERGAYLEKLKGPAAGFYEGMCSGRETMDFRYAESAGNLAEALKSARREDVLTGHTSVGPHRDDIAVFISGMDARAYGSQGQKRSAVLSLKLAEARLLEEAYGEKPVILLDDVLSELDTGRREYLLNHLGSFQVFITCCVPQEARPQKQGALFRMQSGRPSPETPEI